MVETESLLSARKGTHGDFGMNASVSQSLKLTLRCREGWNDLTAIERESIEMICLKISRIMSGQSSYHDHWDDIAGYAKLASAQCKS